MSGEQFDPREMYWALSRHGVEYVTVGDIAIHVYSGQQVNLVLDVMIEASSENMERLAAALRDLDARLLGEDGQRSKSVPDAGLLGSSDLWHMVCDHGRLDITTLPAHLGAFADVRSRAHEIPLEEIIVPIAHRDDLLAMKRSTGRPQDAADVRLLEALGED